MGLVDHGKKGTYTNIRVALGDCAPEHAATVEKALSDRGIQKVTRCETTEGLYRTLDAEVVDLLIYDYHLLGPRFVEVMQRIRRHEVGRNPFLTIIATVRDSSIEIVRRLIDAGVDDLFRAPATPNRLVASVNKSLFRRKPFIISYDYVGPLRPVARSDKSADLVPVRVPNTLADRVFDGAEDDEVRRVVEAAVEKMSTRQILSCGAEIDKLAHRVSDTYRPEAGAIDHSTLRRTLERIGAVADDLRHRASGTPAESISDLAGTLVSIAQRILAAPNGRAAVEVQLLSQLATAMRRALTVESHAAPAIREIANAVGGFVKGGERSPGNLSVA